MIQYAPKEIYWTGPLSKAWAARLLFPKRQTILQPLQRVSKTCTKYGQKEDEACHIAD